MAPESIGPQAARLIGTGRDRIVSSYGLQACAVKRHDPNRAATSQFRCRAIGNLSGGDHQPVWVSQKRLGDGASATQAHIEYTKLTASTVKPIGWRNAHPRSEKDWLKRHPMNAVEHCTGRQDINRQANSAKPRGRRRRSAPGPSRTPACHGKPSPWLERTSRSTRSRSPLFSTCKGVLPSSTVSEASKKSSAAHGPAVVKPCTTSAIPGRISP